MIAKITLSTVFILLAVAHLFIPNIRFDSISIILILLALTPWIYSVLESLEIPGVGTLKFKEIQKTFQKINKALPQKEEKKEQEIPGDFLQAHRRIVDEEVSGENEYSYLHKIAEAEPSQVLVAIRVELEKIVRDSMIGQDKRFVLSKAIRRIANAGILSDDAASGLIELVQLGNRAAHGMKVTKDAIEWALLSAPTILNTLKNRLEKKKLPQASVQYGDYKGTAAADSFSGTNVYEWAQSKGLDIDKYYIIGFEIHGAEMKSYSMYAVKKDLLLDGKIDNLKTYAEHNFGEVPVTRFHFTSSVDEMVRFIKRFNVVLFSHARAYLKAINIVETVDLT